MKKITLKKEQKEKLKRYQSMSQTQINELSLTERNEKWMLEHPGQLLPGFMDSKQFWAMIDVHDKYHAKKKQRLQDEIDAVLAYHDQGKNVHEIAEILGFSAWKVRRIFIRADVQPIRKPWTGKMTVDDLLVM
jgi:hypothetical protein